MKLSDERIDAIIEIYNNNRLYAKDDTAPILITHFSSIIELFSNYACADFALAVFHLTGWKPIEFIFENDDEYGFFHHVMSKHPTENIYFDINGFFSEDDVSKKYFNNKDTIQYHQDLTGCVLQRGEIDKLSLIISEIIVKYWSHEYRQTIS